MTHSHDSSSKKYEKTIVSTSAEVVNWLETQAVGSNAETTMYLDGLTLLRQEALKVGETDVVRIVDLLAGEVARTTESRHDSAARSNGGVLPDGPDGTASPHEVTAPDIDMAVGRFTPNDMQGNVPQDALSVMDLHAGMMNIVENQLKRGDGTS